MTESGALTRSAAVAFCTEHIVPYADDWDRDQYLPDKIVAELAANGWLVPTLVPGSGGAGLANRGYADLAEEFGRSCQSVRNLVAVQGMVAHAILRWGPKHLADIWVAKIARGEAMAAFALTEPQGGSNARHLETSFEYDGEMIIVRGQKSWISFAQRADVIMVIGRFDNGDAGAMLVDAATQGVVIEPIRDLAGFRASQLGKIEFARCSVPRERLVARGPLLFETLVTGALDYGRFSTAAGCVGLAQACLDLTCTYMPGRKGLDRALSAYPLVQARIADMLVHTQASRLLVRYAADIRDQGSPHAIAATLHAKYFCSIQAARCAADSVRLHGAMGLSADYPLQRHFRDSMVNEIIEGATDVIRREIAKLGQFSAERS